MNMDMPRIKTRIKAHAFLYMIIIRSCDDFDVSSYDILLHIIALYNFLPIIDQNNLVFLLYLLQFPIFSSYFYFFLTESITNAIIVQKIPNYNLDI